MIRIRDGNLYLIRCPNDNLETPVPRGKVEALPKNFSLMQMIEQMRIHGKRGKSSSLDSQSVYLGETCCQENPRHRASVHCRKCQADLCESCFEKIHSFEIHRSHRKVYLSVPPLKEKNDVKVQSKINIRQQPRDHQRHSQNRWDPPISQTPPAPPRDHISPHSVHPHRLVVEIILCFRHDELLENS
ncbi:unnamed protein product [Caenorhabditis sp. 36 PRJEB53466]|nr:unnamed protein product [Caenorhabditis sp. 36 PRJEB53466]